MNMKTVILCGGYGTRIRDVSENIPKPMIPIGDRPILWHIMKYYAQFGYKNFVLCAGYKGQVIKDFFFNYEMHTKDFQISLGGKKPIIYLGTTDEDDWEVSVCNTGLNTMTGARIKKIQSMITDDDFFLTYGDGLGDVDLDKLLDFHKSHKKVLTVTGVRPPGRFGEITSENGLVRSFNEKPQVTGGMISGGFFVANRRIFNYLNDDEGLVFEEGPIKKLINDEELMVFRHDGFWQPMDTHREFLLLNSLLKGGGAPWVKW